jgi:predicted TIM-barrel fold metal-dependent hydrolase
VSVPDVVDAYGHVGLPRFQSAADYRRLMAPHGITGAVLSAFDSSPDLADIHRALAQSPETFRALGVPLGSDRDEMQAGVAAQLAAGFSGLRLSEEDVLARPWLLDQVAQAGRVSLVTGRCARPQTAELLLDVLVRHDDCVLVAGHFAGGGRPVDLGTAPVAQLFAHPRFHVVFSRQGGYPAAEIEAWARAIVAVTGWQRILWGSETPVLFWRDETLAESLAWVDRLQPSPPERSNFFSGNARRVYFSHPLDVAPLELPFDPFERRREIPAQLFASGLRVNQRIAGRLTHAWVSSGGQGSLGGYVERLFDDVLPAGPT